MLVRTRGEMILKNNEYQKDKECEEIISLWMEENLFKNETFPGTYCKNNDIRLQKSGVDGFLKHPDVFNDEEYHAIDEKSATTYIRTKLEEDNIPTFAFELDYKSQNGARNEGWLFGNQYDETEYYLLSWIWANVTKKNNGFGRKEEISKDNILKVKAFLIAKQHIHEYLEPFKVTKENFMVISQRMRSRTELKKSINPEKNKRTPNIQFSKHIKEQPVNVIISEYYLKQLSIKTWEVKASRNKIL